MSVAVFFLYNLFVYAFPLFLNNIPYVVLFARPPPYSIKFGPISLPDSPYNLIVSPSKSYSTSCLVLLNENFPSECILNLVELFVVNVVEPASVFKIFKSRFDDYILCPVVLPEFVNLIVDVVVVSLIWRVVSGVSVLMPNLLFTVS